MLAFIRKSNWLMGALVFFMPILLVFFLGSQMAYSQVKGQFETTQTIPEFTRLSELLDIPDGQVVMLRGRIAPESCRWVICQTDSDLIIFKERPAGGREVRFREEFPQHFPKFVMSLPDGQVAILPSSTREHIIQDELHISIAGDRERVGFRVGDVVMVQGRWESRSLLLRETTGITSLNKQQFIHEWQTAFQKVSWARNGLGLLTLFSLALGIVQFRRINAGGKTGYIQVEEEEWLHQKTESAPTI